MLKEVVYISKIKLVYLHECLCVVAFRVGKCWCVKCHKILHRAV